MTTAVYRDISFAEPPKLGEKEGLKTVEFSFASESPYVRLDYSRWEMIEESLKCEASAIAGNRLQNGLIQFLWNHDIDAVRGVITSIDWRGGRGYATAKLSRSPAAEQLYQDIKDEIIKGISLMYRVYEYETLEKAVYAGTGWDAELISPEKVKAINWEIFEISAVSIPADATVGIGRSLKEFDQIPTTVPKLIQAIGLKKVQEVVKKMTAEKDDVKRSPDYLELNQKYLEVQGQLTTVTSERDALKSQNTELQSQLNEHQKRAKLTDKYVALKAKADELVTATKLAGHEYTELFGRSLDDLLKTEEPAAELRAMEIVLNSAEKRSAMLNTKKSQIPPEILEDPELPDENLLNENGEVLTEAAKGYQNAHRSRRN
jgi:hypothetical protein